MPEIFLPNYNVIKKIPLQLYGTIKAHKPENYPMRTIVPNIGTPAYGISKYLVEIIQPTLDLKKLGAEDWLVKIVQSIRRNAQC